MAWPLLYKTSRDNNRTSETYRHPMIVGLLLMWTSTDGTPTVDIDLY